MRIVVAPDSFKGALDAQAAAAAIERGLRSVLPAAEILMRPMADGGEGTAEILRAANDGETVPARVTGPLSDMEVVSSWVSLRGPVRGAVVEMARASGMTLLRRDQLDPLVTTTRGTGELMLAAAATHPERLWLTAGGSATVDGGTGAALALGWRFLDDEGREVDAGGAGLARIRRLVAPEPSLGLPPVAILTDVTNPLIGERGAARVFGPQKGADAAAVAALEEGLENLAERIEAELDLRIAQLAGGGAAGGLGAGAVAFFDAEIVPGGNFVARVVGLGSALEDADWVVTAEGQLDGQSLDGKVVSAVIEAARGRDVRVAVLPGRNALDADRAAEAGIDAIVPVTPEELALDEAIARTEELLESAAGLLARSHLLG